MKSIIKNGGNEKMQDEKKKITLLEHYLQRWLPIVISVVALIFSVFNTGITLQQKKLNEIFSPATFEVDKGDQSISYKISDVDGTYELPAYETKLFTTTGALREFAQINYNGVNLDIVNTTFNVKKSSDYIITSEGQIPKQNYVSDEFIYDYYFIYTVSASGQKELWLVYYTLDLEQKTVDGPFKTDDVILLSLENEPESPKREMLESYQKLYEIVNTLPSI